MGFFAQADEVFDGEQTARQPEDDIDRDKASQLQPGEGSAIDAKPQRLSDNNMRLGWRLAWEAPMEEIDDGQDRAGQRHDGENEETPAGHKIGQRLCDEEIQSAPAGEQEDERRDAKGFEGELRFVHGG